MSITKSYKIIPLIFVILISTLFSQEKENLGPNINSPYDDFAPVISPDGKTLYFCRDGHPDNIGKKHLQDIWFSVLNPDGSWSPAKNIGKPLNDDKDNNVNSVSPDGNVLLLGNIYKGKGEGFSVSYRNGNKWSKPEKLAIKNFVNHSQYASAFLSNNGKVLLMGIQSDDSYGNNDIYVSFLGDDGVWSEPMNLGSTINTKEYEDAPFLAADGLTLYFTSKGHGGFGGADIFMSHRLDKSWKKWSKPVNVGKPVNTAGDDITIFFPANGDFAYFSSTEESMGGQDIFRAKLSKKFMPQSVVLISGKVINGKTKEPVDAKVYYETLPDGDEAGVARTNPETGEYKIVLPSGHKYGYRAEAKGYISVNQSLDETKGKEYREIEKNLELVPIEKGQTAVMNNIFFDFNKSVLSSDSYPELNRLIKMMNEYPKMKIEVAGYTDNVGAKEFNQKLSEKRAKAVADYIAKKIDKDRIVAVGYGDSEPVADNSTDEGRSQNRRVELKILSY